MSGGTVNGNRKYQVREEKTPKTVKFPPELLERIDQARGAQSLNAWVLEACASALYYQTGEVA